VPAGSFKCYKLALALIGQTFWVSTDEHRYVVRFAAGGVTADLAKIDVRKPSEVDEVHGENYSLTLPAGWNVYQPAEMMKKQEGVIAFLLDPRAEVRSQVDVRPKGTLKENQRDSTKAWTESVLDDFKNTTTEFKLRDAGLTDIQVGGRPATAMVADFTRDGKKMTIYGVAEFGEKWAASMRFVVDADKFEELRKEFETIVASLKVE
jgi:hypothetical protein